MSQRHPGLPLARCGAFRRGSSALHKHARAAELGAATRLANRAPGAAEPMTPSRKRCVPRRPEPCEARRGHPARLTLPWSPWRYHCHCSPPTALGQLRGGGSGACTTRIDQRGRVMRGGHLIEPHARRPPANEQSKKSSNRSRWLRTVGGLPACSGVASRFRGGRVSLRLQLARRVACCLFWSVPMWF